MKQSSFLPYVYITAFVFISSCMASMGDVKKEDDVATQISNLQALTASNVQSIEELKTENEKLKGEIEKLHHILGQQTQQAAQQTSAAQQSAAQQTGLQSSIPKTTPSVDSQPAQDTVTAAAAAIPENMDIDEKYKTARKLHEEKKYDDAEKYYISMVGSKSSWYDERARFFLGSVYYDKGNYKQAVVTLQDFIDQYPKSKNVSTAMYIQGECFMKLKQKKEAEVFYKDLVSRFPNSKEAAKAKQRLSRI